MALRFSSCATPDPRRYNKPSSREVAVVFVGDGGVPDRFVQIYARRTLEGSGDQQQLSYHSAFVDPLVYPLVHLDGMLGYSESLQMRAFLGKPLDVYKRPPAVHSLRGTKDFL